MSDLELPLIDPKFVKTPDVATRVKPGAIGTPSSPW